MPYTPDATLVTQPANTGVAASTAAAEFRALKLYIRDVILAPLLLKRNISDTFFSSEIDATLGGIACGSGGCDSQIYTCSANNGYAAAGSGFLAGTTAVGLRVSQLASIGWGNLAGTASVIADAATINENQGNLVFQYTDSIMHTVTVTNSKVGANDMVIMHMVSGIQPLYRFDVVEVGAGFFKYQCQGLGTIPLNHTVAFAVIKRGA